MYITSDLFPPLHGDHSSSSPQPHTWNTMTDRTPSPGLGKRKRRHEEPDVAGTKHLLQGSPAAHKAFGKQYAHIDAGYDGQRKAPSFLKSHFEARPVKQLRRTPKLLKQPSHFMDVVAEAQPAAIPSATVDLRKCHICHKGPSRKKDLENYVTCQDCSERACYVCARACAGGCDKNLCSTCTVEVGHDGDTWCQECYSRHVSMAD